MSHDLGLGKIITTDQKRDAIHVAVAPIVAGEELSPGEHIGVNDNGEAIGTNVVDFIGIVDPFLRDVVNKGEKFWIFVYPNTVTGMRHQWEHPKFGSEGALNKALSEQWLRNFVDNSECPDYDTVIAAASGGEISEESRYEIGYSNKGGSLHFSGVNACGEIPPEFWDHVEVVTGVKVPNAKRAEYFSCSC